MSRESARRRIDRCGRAGRSASPSNLYDYAEAPEPRIGRPPKHDLATWTVTDDWPKQVPITNAEVDVFEAWFGDLFDELFGAS